MQTERAVELARQNKGRAASQASTMQQKYNDPPAQEARPFL